MFMNLSWRHTLVLFVVVMGFVFIGTGCAGGVNDKTVPEKATSLESTTMSEEVTTESLDEIVTETVGVSMLSEGEIEADNDFWMSPITALPEDYAFSERPVYQKAVAQGVYLPEAYSDALSGRAIHTVAKAIMVEGEVVGVIGIDVLGN